MKEFYSKPEIEITMFETEDVITTSYDTPIGENGLGISEGQAQRIAIARTLLSGCNFLLIDEATSALDENTEAEILKNISSLKNKTCIIDTHRKSALKICHRHYLFTNQSIKEIFC